MPHEEQRTQPHALTLTGRQALSVSGVTDVSTFDESAIAMETSQGTLTVRGENLHVEKLSLDQGELTLTGEVQALEYDDDGPQRGGLFGHVFDKLPFIAFAAQHVLGAFGRLNGNCHGVLSPCGFYWVLFYSMWEEKARERKTGKVFFPCLSPSWKQK